MALWLVRLSGIGFHRASYGQRGGCGSSTYENALTRPIETPRRSSGRAWLLDWSIAPMSSARERGSSDTAIPNHPLAPLDSTSPGTHDHTNDHTADHAQ